MSNIFLPTTAERKKKLSEYTIERLNSVKDSAADAEMTHATADQLLCDLLGQLGFLDVVKLYHK